LPARSNSEALQWKTGIYFLNRRPEAALKLHEIETDVEGILKQLMDQYLRHFEGAGTLYE